MTLYIPPLLDFTKLLDEDRVDITIINSRHKFSKHAKPSGVDVQKQPIFGSKTYINGKLWAEMTFGLPNFQFSQGCRPRLTFKNETLFTTNLHIHGLQTKGGLDGGSMETVFGHSTKLGESAVFQYPKIVNNQTLLWIHAHAMFRVMELVYAGLVGLVQIVDPVTRFLSKRFVYGDNHIMLSCLDMDFLQDGTQTFNNLVTDDNRSCFAVVNGTSAVHWNGKSDFKDRQDSKDCQDSKDLQEFKDCNEPKELQESKYHNDCQMRTHITTRNLVKVDVANVSSNWRVFYIGVCDQQLRIHSFYQIQCDSGLMNPTKLTSAYIPVASRMSILIDLDKFKDQCAYVFFYDYDLTEILGSQLNEVPSHDPSSDRLSASANASSEHLSPPPTYSGTVPDFSTPFATPFPTPIPGDDTQLKFPKVSEIPQVNVQLQAGTIPVPDQKPDQKAKNQENIHKHKHTQVNPKHIFLKICQQRSRKSVHLSMSRTISKIQRVVFGRLHYFQYRNLLKQTGFEYHSPIPYTQLLNPKYFYNLPNFQVPIASRRILLFPETDLNACEGKLTEYVNGANRILCDLWNSHQMNDVQALEALNAYQSNPDRMVKPSCLPTSKFRIFKTDDRYSNLAMIANDNLTIEVYDQPIAYGEPMDKHAIAVVKVVFPPTELMNIQQWVNLVNGIWSQTRIEIQTETDPQTRRLSDLLEFDWTFFPYQYQFMNNTSIYIKSAALCTRNKSVYWIKLVGRWPMLQFFGKTMTGNTLDTKNDLMQQLVRKQALRHPNDHVGHDQNHAHSCSANHKPPVKRAPQWTRCDEIQIYGIYDAEIQQLFPFYATNDGNVQLPIACMKRSAELIILPNSQYRGLYDGYLNDNLNSFSTSLKTDERWIYINGDCADSHPFHFHLTSGYVVDRSLSSSPCLVSDHPESRKISPLLYGRDVYQIGPQQTLEFWLTWNHYASSEKSRQPKLKSIGGLIHCHFTQHESSNSMIVQYFVDE